MTTNDFTIKVPRINFEIKANTIYTVKPKVDPKAPDGFRKHGTTKIIHPSVGDTITAPFDVAMGVWDTGFYEFSPCLRGMSPREIKDHLENVQKHLVEPVEAIKGKDVLRHNADNTFYDEYVITLTNKMAFNTAEPLQRLALYLAVLSYQLTPEEEEGNRLFKHSAFVVVNRDKAISAKDKTKIDSGKAMGEFYYLLKQDKPKLLSILKYLGISNTTIQDTDTFITVFDRFLNDKQDGYRNGNIFLEHIEKFNTEEGEKELNVFTLLNKLYDKGVVKVKKREFYFKDHNIGNSLKHAAAKVVSEPELHKEIIETAADLEQEEL